MSFLAPIALIGAALALPIILLYMLRLRRREVMVSSTFLWQQVLRDSEANTPWQKLRRNLLLILQLIILALIVLSLARPFINVPTFTSGQTALLIDASASMNATDGPNGQTRLDAAKAEALEIINTLSFGDTISIIRVADVPEQLTAYTGDAALLRNAVQNIQPSNAIADWTAALTLGAAKASSSENFSMIVISDGGLGDADTLPTLPADVVYIPIGSGNNNVGISALSTRNLPGQPTQLFAQITNYGTQEMQVIFSLRADGELITSQRQTIPPRADVPIVAAALPDGYRIIQADLVMPSDATVLDLLPTDNTAYTISSSGGNRRALLLTQGNLFLEQVFRSMPGVELVRGNIADGLPLEPYDLYIFDNWLPAMLPQSSDMLIINPPNSTPLFTVEGRSQNVGQIVVSNDPRMEFVSFANVNLIAFTVTSNTPWATELIRAQGGPLLLAGDVGGRQVAVLPFNLFESDLPLQITFPVLISNLLEWFTPRSAISATDGLDVGESLAIRPQVGAQVLRITQPNGNTRDIPVDRQLLVYADTQQIGVYTLDVIGENNDALQNQPFAVNLFSLLESDITPRAQVTLGTTVVQQAAEEELGQQEFWPWLALLALLVLMIEWYAYHRRNAMPTLGQALRGGDRRTSGVARGSGNRGRTSANPVVRAWQTLAQRLGIKTKAARR
jgi:Ca-activated chloride channel homolog